MYKLNLTEIELTNLIKFLNRVECKGIKENKGFNHLLQRIESAEKEEE